MKRFRCFSKSQYLSDVYGLVRKQRGHKLNRLDKTAKKVSRITVVLAFGFGYNKTVLFLVHFNRADSFNSVLDRFPTGK